MEQPQLRDTTYFATTNSRYERRTFGIRQADRRSHMYVIGKTGVGKSTLLKAMILQDVKAGVKALAGSLRASKWQVAEAVSKRFREIQHKLPKPRRTWQGDEAYRIGWFLALAAALTMWERMPVPSM